jgi:hypothetical protein
MNFTILNEFRHDFYRCFQRSGDTLFNLCDALLTDTQAHSAIELTLSPCFERQWPSFYEALQTGKLDQARFEQTLVRYCPPPPPGQRLVVAVDASNIERPFSETSPDRGWCYLHNLPDCSKPVIPGWQFSCVVVVPAQASSHTYIVSNRRIPTAQSAAQVAVEQLAALKPYFKERPICLGDRYYPTKDFLHKVSPAYDVLARLKANRVFYADVDGDGGGGGGGTLPRPVQGATPRRRRGAPAKHGRRFQCNDPATHGNAAGEWVGVDERGGRVEVSQWSNLHLREVPELSLSVIRVKRFGASGKRRDPVESWFVWSGQTEVELEQVWPLYKRRYAIEHGFRFDKQDLLWTQPRLREPEHFELWTSLVSVVHDEVHLAEGLGVEVWRPWENQSRPPSPQQIRLGLGRIIGKLGSPARPPKVRGKGVGRAFGAKSEPAARYEVVKKGPAPPLKGLSWV